MTSVRSHIFNPKRVLLNNMFILITPALIGFFLSLLCVHLFLLNEDIHDFNIQLKDIAQVNQKLYKETESSLTHSQINNSPICSKKNLDLMRATLWGKQYIKDIARVNNNQILCSANWGVFDTPIPLPKKSTTLGQKVRHWKGVLEPITGQARVNMTQVGNTLILVKDAILKPYYTKKLTGISLEYTKLPYVFRYIGNTSPLALVHAKQELSLTTITKKSCVSQYSICVTAQNNRLGLLGVSTSSLLTAILLSLLVGVALSYVTHLHKVRRRSLLHHLRKAIDNESIYIHYQPKICLMTHQIIGVEALARWHDDNFGQVPPDIFIEVAEKNNLIKRLSRVVIKQALSHFSDIAAQYPDLTLSINLSMKDLTEPSLIEYINYHAKRHHIAHNRLIFEVTERTDEGFELIEKSVKQLIKVGYKISLDDFGTGYANLSWLSKLQPHEIKVDKTFTQSIGTDSINQNTLNAIFVLLKEMNVDVVFEGIETQEQMDYILGRSHIAIGQGWLFAKPMSPPELSDFIDQNHKPNHHNHDIT